MRGTGEREPNKKVIIDTRYAVECDFTGTDPLDFGTICVTEGWHPRRVALGAGAGKREAAFGSDGGKDGCFGARRRMFHHRDTAQCSRNQTTLSLTERAEVTEKDRQYPMSNGQCSMVFERPNRMVLMAIDHW